MYHPSCTTSLLGRETHTRRAPQELRVSKAETIFRKNGTRSRLGSNAAVRNGSYSQVESLCTNTGNPAPQQPQNKEGVDLLGHARRLRGKVGCLGSRDYSTVTDLAKFLGWSTSQPRRSATLRASSWSGTVAVMGVKQSRTRGT